MTGSLHCLEEIVDRNSIRGNLGKPWKEMKNVLDSGEGMIFVIKLQRTWLNCVLSLGISRTYKE